MDNENRNQKKKNKIVAITIYALLAGLFFGLGIITTVLVSKIYNKESSIKIEEDFGSELEIIDEDLYQNFEEKDVEEKE